MRVALIHYWLVAMRGGEKVLEALCELFPEADVFTHVYNPAAVSESIRRHRVYTTAIQRLPRARQWYQRYLPLMPLALEQLDLRGYQLVISSESGPAKGVIVAPDTVHICYCHTPMRYLWDCYPDYWNQAGGVTRLLMPPLTHYLRMWDVMSAARVDHFVANSHYVARRIWKYYRRTATVIHPPVATTQFAPVEPSGGFYLLVGQLVLYKRSDLAVEAFNELGRRLIIIGEGAQLGALRRRARANIEILGAQPFEVLREYYARCRALIFPGVEDFGIVPVEALASGRPVIAYGKGGVTDVIDEGVTGVLFDEQTPTALMAAVLRFERIEHRFNAAAMRAHSQRFDEAIFKERMSRYVSQALAGLDPNQTSVRIVDRLLNTQR
jgi:glycosyltransferase involved in cell wall biosynthesis